VKHLSSSPAIVLACLLALPAGLTPESFAGQQVQVGKIDPKADKVIRELSQHLRAAKSFRFDVTSSTTMEAQGVKQQFSATYAVSLRRPNKLAIALKKGLMGITIVCDGKNTYTYMPMLKEYKVSPAPEDLDDFVAEGMGGALGMGMGSMVFVSALLRTDPYAVIMDGVSEGKYLGQQEIDGAKHHHVKFSQDELDWEMWVATGQKPLLKKIVPDMSKTFAKLADTLPAQLKDLKMQMTIVFDNWALDVNIPEDAFTFQPPPGARKVDAFFKGPDLAEEGPHPLLGKPAPPFQLDLLDGGKVNLAAHKGKQIVILDFWATWCPPCRRGLPVLAKVSQAYKDKGVVFYAVNLGEQPSKIREFLKQAKLSLSVALDKDGKVGDLYKVEGIPQTVIIGKDGTVQVVHVGFGLGMGKQLREQLDALLAGKNLAAEAEQKPKAKAPASLF